MRVIRPWKPPEGPATSGLVIPSPRENPMSWFSNFLHGVIDAVGGQEEPGPIVNNPSTPIEVAVNTAGQAATQAISETTSVVAQEAGKTVNSYLTTSVGNVGAQFADAALEGLAVSAISKMSGSSNKTEAEIATLLGGFLKSLVPAPAAAA